MNRFTEKIDNEYIVSVSMGIGGYTDVAEEKQYEANQKLGQHEDIEEELGIDLITLFKALKNGIYGKIGDRIEHILAPHLVEHMKEIYIFKIKDYGKTWALTEQELRCKRD